MQNYKQLQFFDTLSLYFHCNHVGERSVVEFLHVPKNATEDVTVEISPGAGNSYVLSPFPKDWTEKINEMIEKACDGIDYFLTHDMKETMNKFNENTNVKGIDG